MRLTSPTAELVIDVDVCPTDEQLNLFLSGDDAGAIGLHLRECARCQEALNRLSDDGALRRRTALSGGSTWDWGDPSELSPIVEALRKQVLFDRGRDHTASATQMPFFLGFGAWSVAAVRACAQSCSTRNANARLNLWLDWQLRRDCARAPRAARTALAHQD